MSISIEVNETPVEVSVVSQPIAVEVSGVGEAASSLGWTSGSGVPTAAARNGSLYLDDVTGSYYKRIAGTWVLQGSLVGPAGGALHEALAGENISALRAVRHSGSALVYCRPNEPASLSPFGISVTAASSGSALTVQTEGRLHDASWAWTVGQAVLVGPEGALTQTQPEGQQHMIAVGFAIASDAMMVRISAPILLSL